MKNLIRENRKKINRDLRTADIRSFFSPSLLGLYRMNRRAVEKYAKGNLLDAGCGDMPYKDLISAHVQRYDTLDVADRTDGVKFIGDIENMDMIQDESYETVVCFEVLEHVPNPLQAVKEVVRVLKKNGTFVISTGHPIFDLINESLDNSSESKISIKRVGNKRIIEGDYFDESKKLADLGSIGKIKTT